MRAKRFERRLREYVKGCVTAKYLFVDRHTSKTTRFGPKRRKIEKIYNLISKKVL